MSRWRIGKLSSLNKRCRQNQVLNLFLYSLDRFPSTERRPWGLPVKTITLQNATIVSNQSVATDYDLKQIMITNKEYYGSPQLNKDNYLKTYIG